MSALIWDRDRSTWPNSQYSHFTEAQGLRWHYQDMGTGPVALLLHGTGASTHSWRDFAPLIAKRFRVIAPDLPGHGFTQSPPAKQQNLLQMACSIAGLLKALDVTPAITIGHSAGAAIACRMSLDGHHNKETPIVSLNGALLPFGGAARDLFPALARLLFLNPLVPSFFAWRAGDTKTVRRLITGTGSNINDIGLSLYSRLFQSSTHVAAALAMMANWDLASLSRDLHLLQSPLTLIAATNDQAIPPDVAFKVEKMVAHAKVVLMRGLGHLAHEEVPKLVADQVFDHVKDIVAIDQGSL